MTALCDYLGRGDAGRPTHAAPEFIRSFLASERRLCPYLVWLHSSRGAGYSTIKWHLAGLAFWATSVTGSSPPVLATTRRFLKGVLRLERETPRPRRNPFTPSLLGRMFALSPMAMGICELDMRFFRAMCAVAFQGCLRSSEYLTTRDPGKLLRMADVVVGESSAYLTLRRTKNNQAGAPEVVELLANKSSPICPVAHLKAFLAARKGSTAREAPFFVSSTGRAATVGWLNARLKHALLQCGVQAEGYSSHSLRIGAVDTAGREGASEEQLAELGRWKHLSSVQFYKRAGTAKARELAARRLVAASR